MIVSRDDGGGLARVEAASRTIESAGEPHPILDRRDFAEVATSRHLPDAITGTDGSR